MAIGWLTVLQSVPWSDVVSNAPKVAVGAKKLWNAVARKPTASLNAAAQLQPEPETSTQTQAQALAALESRVAELATVALDLQNQMVESSGLITALAEQNTQLIHRIETMRLRMGWLAGALALVGTMTAAGMVFALTR
jgi:hypothetical protein